MYIDNQYNIYQIAYHYVKTYQYDVLFVSDQEDEIWLEKKEGKKSTVIRFLGRGFDWKNYLKKDIAVVFQKVKAMKRLLRGKVIQIYNVYISEHEPVDDWEMLKKPMQLNEKHPISMNVYYLSDEQFVEEKIRLEKDTDITINTADSQEPIDKESQLHNYKKYLKKNVLDQKEQTQAVFSFGKPLFTYLILAICIGMFVLVELNGGSSSMQPLIDFGAKYNPAIIEQGEWWRIISSMFLHIGFLHLLMNMLAVYYLGTLVERIYGSFRFLCIYFLAGIGGGIASFAFSPSIAAGASGALFGLFGALLFFGLHNRKIFFQTMGTNVLVLIGINIVFGLFVPQIDNGAHLGGLVAGFIASGIVHLPKRKETFKQMIAIVLYCIIAYGLIQFGYYNNMNNQVYHVMQIEELLKQEKYEAIISQANQAIESEGNLEAAILFHRSYAYIELNQDQKAIEDLERSIEIDHSFPEAYYNLAILYKNNGKVEKAKSAIESAYQLNPDNDDFIRLYEQLTGKSAN